MHRLSPSLRALLWSVLPGLLAGIAAAVLGANAGTIILVMLLVGGGVWALWKVAAWSHREARETLESAWRRLEAALVVGGAPPDPVLSDPQTLEQLAGELYAGAGRAEAVIATLMTHQRQLEQSRTLLETVLGAMAEGVLVLDGDRQVLFANAVCRSLLDISHGEVVGRPVLEACRSSELQEVLEKVLAEGGRQRHEVRLKRRKVILEVNAARLPLSPRAGVVVVLHNVTELRRLEQMRREFVSNVSHELKTPLTAIQAYADTLLDGGLEDAQNNKAFVARIIEQSDRLQELIQDMLRLARIESQMEAFEFRPVRLAEVIQASVVSREPVAAARQVALSLSPGDLHVEVVADAGGLRTIVDNLVSNAINYTPAGGAVNVRWAVVDRQVMIEVEDSGVGIPAEHQQRIFERFYRVERARSRSGGGTGLGLSIVKHLATVFGGSVEVESEVGRGSLFRVRLPVVQPERSLQSSPSAV